MMTIDRRSFIALGGAGAAFGSMTRPIFAQDAGRTYRLGFVVGRKRDADIFGAFFDELRLFGFTEGQNLAVLPEGFGLRNEQFAAAVAANVKAAVDVIVTAGDPAARTVQEATRTIPIVALADDMVEVGLVPSLAHPGGNLTSVSLLAPEFDGKRLNILEEAMPGAHKLAALSDAASKPSQFEELRDAARLHNIELTNYPVASPEQIAPAIDAVKASGAAGLNVRATALFSVNRRIVIERATAARLPAIYQWPDMAEEGGMIAYGPRITTTYRQMARQVVKVLRGVNPADVPVEQPTNFEMVINLQAAKAIGHEVPAFLVARADKVIE